MSHNRFTGIASDLNAQQILMQLILQPQLSSDPVIQIFQRNRWALALRALGISFPVVAQLMGDSFSGLAHKFLQAHPPTTADWGDWGNELPAFIYQHQATIGLDYLAQVAQLEWYMHQVERNNNAAYFSDSLNLLAQYPVDQIYIRFNENIYFMESEFPIHDIWAWHQPNSSISTQQLQASVQYLASRPQAGFQLVVSRSGWRAQVQVLDNLSYQFMQHLINGLSLSSSLDSVLPYHFDFSAWLTLALKSEWISEFFLSQP